MGYSVLIPLGKREREKVSRFLDALTEKGIIGPATANPDGTAKADSLFGAYTSDPRMQNLSYSGRYKDGNYVGCDYGDYSIAHTFINWMGTVLGKKTYVYDGSEKYKIKPKEKIVCSRLLKGNLNYKKALASWKHLNLTILSKEEWAERMAEERKFYLAYRRQLRKLVDTLQKVWNETL